MGDRVQRGANSKFGGKVLRRHGGTVERAADLGAKSFGLGWLYLLGIYAVVVLIAWILAFVFGGYFWLVAVGVSAAVGPPIARELRKRDEVRRQIRGD
jgi:hypothetical protein